MVEGSKSFVRFDLAITKRMHLANIANKVYPVLDPDLDPALRIQPEDAPNLEDLKVLLDRVGKPYGWDRRKEYHTPESIEKIETALSLPTTKRFSFWSGSKEVGGTIIANVEPDVERIFEKARDGESPIDISADMSKETIEIYKIGLFPEYTKRGWGKHFLPDVLTALFEDASQPDVVYLNTRSTNHAGVISFYTGFNMNVIHARTHADDLLSDKQIKRAQQRAELAAATAAANASGPERRPQRVLGL